MAWIAIIVLLVLCGLLSIGLYFSRRHIAALQVLNAALRVKLRLAVGRRVALSELLNESQKRNREQSDRLCDGDEQIESLERELANLKAQVES